jgi:hypothetical protein
MFGCVIPAEAAFSRKDFTPASVLYSGDSSPAGENAGFGMTQ